MFMQMAARRRRMGGFSPLGLFRSSEPGVWLDPSDLTTLFQDTAGTTTVTAAGQSVGRILDKSGRGNHATQSIFASRPIYGVEPSTGRRNLLTRTEELHLSPWTTSASADTTVTQGSGDGFTTIAFTAPSSDRRFVRQQTVSDIPSGEFAFIRARFRPGPGVTRLALGTVSGLGVFGFHSYDIVTGIWQGYNLFDPGAYSGISAQEIAPGVWELVVRFTRIDRAVNTVLVHFGSGSASDLRLNSPVATCDVGFVQWSRTNEPYQRVGSQYDVTEAGLTSVAYLFDDLIDDALNWTAPAGNYTVAWCDTAGNVTIQTAQALSGATDALRTQRMVGYLAINRALTAAETANLTAWFKRKAGV